MLLAPSGNDAHLSRLVDAFDPDVLLTGSSAWTVEERRTGSAHSFHPDLAVLMSTSGSTGSPRLVRLSHRNLHTNATAIARYLGLTQAGGRLSPDRARRYAELGERDGWDLYVMYGQLEATARMAYLPPALARSHPTSIGIPIPGGTFDIEPVDGADAGVGELVYRGPNVMLGYADDPGDLASGATLDALHTGDLARRTDEGRFEIVGRQSRIAVPSMVWLAIASAMNDWIHLAHVLLLNGWFGGDDAHGGYWYVEAIVQIGPLVALLGAVTAGVAAWTAVRYGTLLARRWRQAEAAGAASARSLSELSAA